tara:strand:- start:703 stop:1962 length:1260 start_codon:yes stop_codon:yes gene_type:complete
MSLLLKNALLVEPDLNRVVEGNLVIRNGFIDRKDLRADAEIDCNGKFVAPGIVDLGVKVSEPGESHKESYESAGKAAAAGGVTTIITRPDTKAAIDTPETFDFVKKKGNEDCIVNVFHIAALTKERKGREICEIGMLSDAGAIAFSDCDNVMQDNKIFSRVLKYASELDTLVIGHPQDKSLTQGAVSTSGKFATLKGLPSASPIAERIGLERDLALVEMTNAKYHFDQITTISSIEVFRRAKKSGLDISAGTSIHHLCFNELDIADYKTFFKIKPPLRSENDRLATIEAVRDGTIKIISSMHTPQDEESKRLPFEDAASGAVGLETILPAMLRLYHSDHLKMDQIFNAISLNPAKRLGLACGSLKHKKRADLIIFDADKPFILNRELLHSKVKNTPFDGQKLQGQVLRTFVNGIEVFSL